MTEAAYDVEALRLERLARLQTGMRRHGVEVCVLFNEPNIRYATGASAMPVYAMSTFVRCAVVPQEGTPILFEHANSMHRSALRAPDVRPMHAWEFYDDPQAEAERWADETLAAIQELGSAGEIVAVERGDVLLRLEDIPGGGGGSASGRTGRLPRLVRLAVGDGGARSAWRELR